MSSISFTSSLVSSSRSAKVRSITNSGMATIVPGSDGDEPTPVCVRGGLSAVGASRRAKDAADVIRGRVLADRELASDVAVREPSRDQPEDLDLPRREVVRERARGGRQTEAETTDPRGQRVHADDVGGRRRLAEERRTPRPIVPSA